MKHILPDNARPSCAQVHWAKTLRDRLPSHLIHGSGRPSCAQVIWAEALRDRLASHSINCCYHRHFISDTLVVPPGTPRHG